MILRNIIQFIDSTFFDDRKNVSVHSGGHSENENISVLRVCVNIIYFIIMYDHRKL